MIQCIHIQLVSANGSMYFNLCIECYVFLKKVIYFRNINKKGQNETLFK